MHLTVVIVFAAFFATDFRQIASQQIAQSSGEVFTPFAKCFFVIHGEFTYDQAKAACNSRRAFLGFFFSPSEEHTVRKHIEWSAVPGFQDDKKWNGQLWIASKWSKQLQTWVFDELIPGAPMQFTPFSDPDVAKQAPENAECAVMKKEGWDALNCNRTANKEGSQQGVGALCTMLSRHTPDDGATANSRNFCEINLLPPSASSIALPIVALKHVILVKGDLTFDEAQMFCASKGGSLFSARYKEDFDLIHKSLNFTNRVWLGLKRESTGSSNFIWVDDNLINHYTVPFAPNQPDNSNDCVTHEKGGKDGQQAVWRSAPCCQRYSAICELYQFL